MRRRNRADWMTRSPSVAIRASYMTAILVVAGFIIASHIWSDRQLVDRKDLAAVINTSGRQRMLSQRIAKLVLSLQPDDEAYAPLRIDLEQSYDEWAGSHGTLRGLTFGDRILEESFERIEPSFVAVEAVVLEALAGSTQLTAERRSTLAAAEAEFLVEMEGIVSRYEMVARAQTERWRVISRSLAGGALFILILEVIFIFNPLVRRVSWQFLELEESQEHLRRANRDLEGFTSAASHDLRSPLRAMQLLSSWVLEDEGNRLTDESREHLAKLTGRSDRMESYLEGLRKYSVAGRPQSSPEEVLLPRLVDEVISDLDGSYDFDLNVDGEAVTLRARLIPLRSVVQNIVENAVKHCRTEHRHARITWRVDGAHVRIVVEDNGPGVPEPFRDKIFDMFQTLRPKDEFEASGVGLAISARLAENEGAEISVDDSEDLGGARFEIRWPLAA